MEPHAQPPSRLPLGSQQVPRPGGEDVVAVKDGGAAVFHQLPHGHLGGEKNGVLVQALPDLIQGGEPVEQLQVLHLGQVAGEGLIQMVVGVDQAGIAEHPCPVDDPVGGLRPGADGTDHAVLCVEVGVMIDTVLSVAGDEGTEMPDQKAGHG